MAKSETKAEASPLPPLCVAGCAHFTQASNKPDGFGICRRHPQKVQRVPGDYCGDFETIDQYRKRVKAQL